HLWVLTAWALAGVVGLIGVTTLRRPAPALTGPVVPSAVSVGPGPTLPDGALVPGFPAAGTAQPARPVTLVVGFDNSEPARRALIWGADLLRARPGTLHVVYADHRLIDSDLSGFGAPRWTRPATTRPRTWPGRPGRSPRRRACRTRSNAARNPPPTRSCRPP